MLAAHFALAGSALGTAVVFGIALLVHPTNVFLAPFLVLVFAGGELARRGRAPALRRTTLVVVLCTATLSLLAWTTTPAVAASGAAGAAARAASPSSWLEFGVLYVRLLTGDTVLTYITGAGLGAAQLPTDIAATVLLAALLAFGARTLRTRAVAPEAGVVAGWLVSLAAFAVVAGPAALRPHFERFGMWAVVPTIFAVTVLLRETARSAAGWTPVFAVTAAVAVAAAVALGTGYFAALERNSSTSHETFWTGPAEPKAEAFRLIDAEARARGGARVVVDSFWLHWPLAYLAWGGVLDVRDPGHLGGRVPTGGTYWVGFAGGGLEPVAAANPAMLERWSIPAAGGRSAIRIWWTPPDAAPLRTARGP